MLLYVLFTSAAYAAGGDEEVGFTLVDIWNHSGWLARGVIVMLVIMLVGSLIVSVERFIAFTRARSQSMALAAGVVKPLQNKDVAGALKIVNNEAFKVSYLGALLRAGLRELAERRDEYGVQNAERAIDKAVTEEIAKLRRGMTILATVGSTGPFVGLFGTTFGVINAFQGMATKGSGLAGISAGISEALITTGVGIGVAVVGVWFFNYFNQRIDKVSDELNSSAHDFTDWAHKLIQPEAEPVTDPGVAQAGK